MIEGLYNRIKIRAACDVLGLSDRDARLMVQIYGLSKKTKNDEVFVLPEGESLEKKLGMIYTLKDREDSIGEQARDIIQMFTDPNFRLESLRTFAEQVKPVVEELNWKDVLRILKTGARE